MNTTSANDAAPHNLPFWNELSKLSKSEKESIIALLSMSINDVEQPCVPEDGTHEFLKRCCGSWKGEQSAEEIIANINESKTSDVEPETFD